MNYLTSDFCTCINEFLYFSYQVYHFYRMSSSGQPFPMSKLLYMYVKKFAEPLANRIIARAKTDDIFKRFICLPPANLYHLYESKVKYRVMNIGKIRMKSVPKMTEKEAIILGGNLFAECCFYAFASGTKKLFIFK